MKRWRSILTAAVCACGAALAMSVPASAAGSVEDVLDAMRRVGFSEANIQNARIQYENSEHDENGVWITRNGKRTYTEYDVLAEYVEIYQQDYIWKMLSDWTDVAVEDLQSAYATLPAASNDDPESTETTPAFTPSVPMEKPFINMTLEEKRAYLDSLPESERAAFLVTLTPQELRSIYKQVDTDQKATLAQGISDIGSQLGMNVSVDQIEGNNISVSIRDGEGVLIDNAAVGEALVDDTGWDLRLPIFASSGAILLGLTGVVLLALREGKKQEECIHE